MKESLPTRLNMKTEGTFGKKLLALMKKKGLEPNGVISLAVTELHERVFPEEIDPLKRKTAATPRRK